MKIFSNYIRSFSKHKIKNNIFIGFYIMNWNFVGYCTYDVFKSKDKREKMLNNFGTNPQTRWWF